MLTAFQGTLESWGPSSRSGRDESGSPSRCRAAAQRAILAGKRKGFSFARALRRHLPPPGGVRLLSQLWTAVSPDALFISAGARLWPRAMGQDGAVQLSHPTQHGAWFSSLPPFLDLLIPLFCCLSPPFRPPP